MSQLRLDPLTGRWVVVSNTRAGRPRDFAAPARPVEGDPGRPCPFCPGNEEATPPALESYGSDGEWRVRVVPNKFPAFSGSTPLVVSHLGPVFTQAPAGGIHEVLVLSADHTVSWADLPDDQVALVMAAIGDRIAAHSHDPGLRYSQVIVNSGREAGASIEHPHGQLLGLPLVPREVADEQAGFARFQGGCLLCTTAGAELHAGHRLVHVDDDVVVVCPFWSGSPYELLVVPRAHGAHLQHAPAPSLTAVGLAIRTGLQRLRASVGAVAYNLVFHSAPYRAAGPYHWHAHLVPKLATVAGFELGTGMMINVVAPEAAAGDLRADPPAFE